MPIAFLDESTGASNNIQRVVRGPLFHFGILTSTMHMAWMRAVGGRLKSDYSYSPAVYNNFPWPELPESGAKPLDSRVRGNDEQGRKHRTAIETAAQGVLDARAGFPDATLADLYEDRKSTRLNSSH